MPRKIKSLPRRIRDLHAAEPGLSTQQIATRLKTYRQRVESALKATGEKTGPKPREKCERCHGTGYEPVAHDA